uniref:Uncharacterized protein n=1 Tax=Oreochromis niloticus TaxID=8128 RepID=A0A669ERZ5_ORENI
MQWHRLLYASIWLLGHRHQTARVATVGFCFHTNFNYHWLRGLEMLPGGGVKAVTGKVVVDQLIAAPLTISAFYIGMCVSKLI